MLSDLLSDHVLVLRFLGVVLCVFSSSKCIRLLLSIPKERNGDFQTPQLWYMLLHSINSFYQIGSRVFLLQFTLYITTYTIPFSGQLETSESEIGKVRTNWQTYI